MDKTGRAAACVVGGCETGVLGSPPILRRTCAWVGRAGFEVPGAGMGWGHQSRTDLGGPGGEVGLQWSKDRDSVHAPEKSGRNEVGEGEGGLLPHSGLNQGLGNRIENHESSVPLIHPAPDPPRTQHRNVRVRGIHGEHEGMTEFAVEAKEKSPPLWGSKFLGGKASDWSRIQNPAF